MRRFLLCLCLLTSVGIMATSPGSVAATPKPKIVTTASATPKAGEAPKELKGKPTNGTGPEVTAPSSKGGPKSRDFDACQLTWDNWTPWYIDLYVDGTWVGTMGPWGEMYGVYRSGAELYARANFDDGSYKYWGPTTLDCTNLKMVWKLGR